MMLQDFAEARKRMVASQLRPRGINDRRVLDAFEFVPRHLFVPEDEREWSYDDYPLPIGFQQTISQPYIVGYMLQMLALTGTERVLEVGTGSGYQTALLSRLVAEVHTIELIPALAERASNVLVGIEATNIFLHIGDGSQGWTEAAPYDAIVVSAAAPQVPQPLLDQLADHGRMILPVGERGFQELELWRHEGDSFTHESLLAVAFVPLRRMDGE